MDDFAFTFTSMSDPESHLSKAERDEMMALYTKAIASPLDITDTERRRILRRPSFSTEAANVAAVTNGTLTPVQLIAKAASAPDTLTFAECDLLNNSLHVFASWDANFAWRNETFALPERVRDALFHARDAVASAEERSASANVLRVLPAKREEKQAKEEEKRKRVVHESLQWVRDLKASGKDWGFAMMTARESRAGGAKRHMAWLTFLEACEHTWKHPLVFVEGGEEIKEQLVCQWIDADVSVTEPEELRRTFRITRDLGHVKKGMLRNTIILFTTEGLETAPGAKPMPMMWVWAYDPDWRQKDTDGDEDGYEGRVKVSWRDLLPGFYVARLDDEVTLKDLWKEAQAMEGQIWDANPWGKYDADFLVGKRRKLEARGR